MRIYIRHSDKMYKNGPRGHDPPLTDRGRGRVGTFGCQLYQRYGMPSTIICSPFLRCRETAELLHRAVYEQTGVRVGIKCDKDISEYLGNRVDEELMVTEITLLFQPPHPETFHEMEQRVHHHNDRMRDYDLTRRPVWIVTHGLIIDRLLFFMGFKRPQSIPTLSFFVFHQKTGDKAQVRGWYHCTKKTRRLKR